MLIIFIAAISYSIVIEERASGVLQPFRLLCGEILNLPFIFNKHFDFESTLCPEAVTDASQTLLVYPLQHHNYGRCNLSASLTAGQYSPFQFTP